MLGGWLAGPRFLNFIIFGDCEMREMETLRELMNTFSPEEKERVVEILRLTLELTHLSMSG